MMIIDAHVHLSLYKGNAGSLAESKDVLSEMRQHDIDWAIVIRDNKEWQPDVAGLETARKLIGESESLPLLGSLTCWPVALHALLRVPLHSEYHPPKAAAISSLDVRLVPDFDLAVLEDDNMGRSAGFRDQLDGVTQLTSQFVCVR